MDLFTKTNGLYLDKYSADADDYTRHVNIFKRDMIKYIDSRKIWNLLDDTTRLNIFNAIEKKVFGKSNG